MWYADYSIQDYSEGVCTNERPLPNGRATYDSQLSCCKAAYGDQISGTRETLIFRHSCGCATNELSCSDDFTRQVPLKTAQLSHRITYLLWWRRRLL